MFTSLCLTLVPTKENNQHGIEHSPDDHGHIFHENDNASDSSDSDSSSSPPQNRRRRRRPNRPKYNVHSNPVINQNPISNDNPELYHDSGMHSNTQSHNNFRMNQNFEIHPDHHFPFTQMPNYHGNMYGSGNYPGYQPHPRVGGPFTNNFNLNYGPSTQNAYYGCQHQ